MSSGRGNEQLLAIGPANFAGQGTQWCRAVSRNLGVATMSFAYGRRLGGHKSSGPYSFPVDVVLPHPKLGVYPLRDIWTRHALCGCTHLALDGFLSLREKVATQGPGSADLKWLAKRVEALALIAHGSDVRNPDIHMAEVQNSYFRRAAPEWIDARRQISRSNREFARDNSLPLFASTPGLVRSIPEATWLPLTVDMSLMEMPRSEVLIRDRIRILHQPTRRIPAIKGTDFIEPVLDKMQNAGLIEWVRPGAVSHSKMVDIMMSCDLVIDQISTGDYGVTTVEALALGRLVVGDIQPEVRSAIPGYLPIVQAAPSSLEDVLHHVLSERNTFSAQAGQGTAFARQYHDGQAAARALSQFLDPGK